MRSIQQAAAYIRRVGFCLLFPIKGLKLPSLFTLMKEGWAAVKGSRGFGTPRRFDLVAAWDADTERLWEWKDEFPRRRRAYFGRYFRDKKSLIALAFFPCFYRLEGNYGSPEEHERLYREGCITADARAVCAQLHKHGPQAALELRYALGWTSKRGNQRFKRALGELQQRLLITHWGTKAETAAWASVVYELTPRAFPRAVRAALKLTPEEARRRIAARYRKLNPKAAAADLSCVFRWARRDASAALG